MQVIFNAAEFLIQESLKGYNYKDKAFKELRAINKSHCLGAFSLCIFFHENWEILFFSKKTNWEDSVVFNTTIKKI